MTKPILTAAAVLSITLLASAPARAQTAGEMVAEVQEQVQETVREVRESVDPPGMTLTQNRDALTLAIGGGTGFAAGHALDWVGLISLDLMGVALLPIATGVAGIYLANEGYFDQARAWLDESF
jgi:hypothetical protein